ncbi:MAG: 50S ribosomal protein L4 [Acidobacteria bacterium]|nr:50S ribosomal protein L4 [Acidobacteriota bacterium]MBI3662214.1 50S ribosomal protein L4 [Acidobacteriota bacterium]
MAVVDVKNLEGKTVGTIDLADAVFAAKVNPTLLHETTRWYLAGQRAGTHKVKRRGEVEGSGKKLWRQKGTGRARVGSIRSPIWRKGGTVHGPAPRDYSYRIPRKVLAGALRSALSAKLAEQKLTIVDSFALESHKTKAFRKMLDTLATESRTVLLVEMGETRNLELASRNIAGVKRVATTALQPYDLLRHDGLIVSKDAALRLSSALNPVKVVTGTVVGVPLAQIAPAPAEPVTPAEPKKKPRRKATKKEA